MQVRLNGIDTGDTALLLRTGEGRLLASAGDLQRWRMRLPTAAALSHEGQSYYRLDDFGSLAWKADEARQTLSVEAGAELFLPTRLDLTRDPAATPPPAPPGAFLNYDLASTRADGRLQTGGLLELGVFNGHSGAVGGFALRQGYATGPHALRLETTWTRDMPDQRSSLRMGDAISRAGQWGRAVRFGGVQWATNFATQPAFVTFALPSMSGEAALPSTVDLYVNDALQLRRDIPAGPFSLQQLPVVTGQGEARLVVRDVLGREQVIQAPYYATPRVLRAGLHDFSYEAGRVREDFAVASNHYGRSTLVATHRFGLSDRLTVEGHGEWLESQQTAGLGSVLWWPRVGTLNAAIAASRAERGAGALVALGGEHQAPRFSVGANAQFANAGFTQLGQQPDRLAARRNLQAFASLALPRGSLSLSFVAQTPRDRDPVRLLGLGYSVSLGSFGYLGVSVLRSGGAQGGVLASVNYTRVLDPRTSFGAGATQQGSGTQGQVQMQRNLPAGDGIGYRLLAGDGIGQRAEAGVGVQHAAGTAGLEIASTQGQGAVRASASGGLAWLDGGLFASRRIDSSFAVVNVPDQSGVGVYADNQLVARTGADGRALVSRLRAYETNPIRIEQADLPMDAQIESLQMDAVPAFRSGLVLRFPVRQSRGATLRVLQSDGRPVPPGAVARIDGLGRDFPFGLDGRLYLDGLAASNRIDIAWPDAAGGRGCSMTLVPPADAGPVPDMGELRCHPAAP